MYHSNSGEFDPASPANPPGNAGTSDLFSLSQAQEIAAFCRAKFFLNVPPSVKEILNTTSENDLLNNALKNDIWKDNTIPVYEMHKSHFPEDLYDELELDPDEPDSFLTFFGKMKILPKF